MHLIPLHSIYLQLNCSVGAVPILGRFAQFFSTAFPCYHVPKWDGLCHVNSNSFPITPSDSSGECITLSGILFLPYSIAKHFSIHSCYNSISQTESLF